MQTPAPLSGSSQVQQENDLCTYETSSVVFFLPLRLRGSFPRQPVSLFVAMVTGVSRNMYLEDETLVTNSSAVAVHVGGPER